MALFQKKPQVSDSAPLYTLGLQKNILVIGLGNPGKEYQKTRHNAGFLVADALADKNDGSWLTKKDLKAQICSITIGATRVLIAKPTTFMNDSGQAVQAIQQFYKISPSHLLVIHDELDMPFGHIRTRVGGGSAGHNGVKSVIQHCGEEFGRLRIGVSNQQSSKIDSADFVLANFNKEEQAHLPAMQTEAISIITEYIASEQLPHDSRSFIA